MTKTYVGLMTDYGDALSHYSHVENIEDNATPTFPVFEAELRWTSFGPPMGDISGSRFSSGISDINSLARRSNPMEILTQMPKIYPLFHDFRRRFEETFFQRSIWPFFSGKGELL